MEQRQQYVSVCDLSVKALTEGPMEVKRPSGDILTVSKEETGYVARRDGALAACDATLSRLKQRLRQF